MKKADPEGGNPGIRRHRPPGHHAVRTGRQRTLDQIPYRGAAPALTDLLGGQVDLFFATPQSIVPQVKAGALRLTASPRKRSCRICRMPRAFPALGPNSTSSIGRPCSRRRERRKRSSTRSTKRCRRVSNPAIVKLGRRRHGRFPQGPAFAGFGRNDDESEIARWGQVIRDNNIHLEQ